MEYQNLYGQPLRLEILAIMKAREKAGQQNTIVEILNKILQNCGAVNMPPQPRNQLRQRIYTFLESSTKRGEIIREIKIDDNKRADIYYLLTNKTRLEC